MESINAVTNQSNRLAETTTKGILASRRQWEHETNSSWNIGWFYLHPKLLSLPHQICQFDYISPFNKITIEDKIFCHFTPIYVYTHQSPTHYFPSLSCPLQLLPCHPRSTLPPLSTAHPLGLVSIGWDRYKHLTNCLSPSRAPESFQKRLNPVSDDFCAPWPTLGLLWDYNHNIWMTPGLLSPSSDILVPLAICTPYLVIYSVFLWAEVLRCLPMTGSIKDSNMVVVDVMMIPLILGKTAETPAFGSLTTFFWIGFYMIFSNIFLLNYYLPCSPHACCRLMPTLNQLIQKMLLTQPFLLKKCPTSLSPAPVSRRSVNLNPLTVVCGPTVCVCVCINIYR